MPQHPARSDKTRDLSAEKWSGRISIRNAGENRICGKYICKKGYFSGGQQVRPMPDAVGRDKKEGNPEESPHDQNKVSDFFGYCK